MRRWHRVTASRICAGSRAPRSLQRGAGLGPRLRVEMMRPDTNRSEITSYMCDGQRTRISSKGHHARCSHRHDDLAGRPCRGTGRMRRRRLVGRHQKGRSRKRTQSARRRTTRSKRWSPTSRRTPLPNWLTDHRGQAIPLFRDQIEQLRDLDPPSPAPTTSNSCGTTSARRPTSSSSS
jgi:hypothetical protein